MHTPDGMLAMDMDIPLNEFLGRVLVAALENEAYEIQSVFCYGGNLIDFEMKITNVRPAANLDTLQEQRM